jgi:hypothetical protein
MIIKAGIQSDEVSLEASQLNQTHIGLAFGSNMDDGTVTYGRIAAFHLDAEFVTVHLDGVGSGESFSQIHLRHDDKLFFSRYTRESQLLGSVEAIQANTNK